jgi:hypothetical protein
MGIEYVTCECYECRFRYEMKDSPHGWICGTAHMKDCEKSPFNTIKDYSSTRKDTSRR